MIRPLLCAVATTLLLGQVAVAKDAVPRIGFLANLSPDMGHFPAFLDGLRERGWEDGRNVRIVFRSAQGEYQRHPALARELVRAPVDVIVAFGQGVNAAARATSSIPIVMGAHYGPVQAGHARSLARPGGNVTGLTAVLDAEEGIPKRLALLREGVGRLSRVALVTQASGWAADGYPEWRQDPRFRRVAEELKLDLFLLTFGDPATLAEVLRSAARQGAQAILFDDIPPLHFPEWQRAVAREAARLRLPVMMPMPSAVAEGVLMAYGTNIDAVHRRIAYFVDRILRGARPADLPIEQPAAFELRVNLGAARAIGLELPKALVLRADKVYDQTR